MMNDDDFVFRMHYAADDYNPHDSGFANEHTFLRLAKNCREQARLEVLNL